MAYNNYYPSYYPGSFQNGYQTYQGQQLTAPPQVQPQTQMQAASQTTNPITWVQGEAAAKSFPVAPGTSVLLMDSEASVFYIKTSDASGMPLPLRTFDYAERVEAKSSQVQTPNTIQNGSPEYITRDEFEKRIAEIERVKHSEG